MSIDYSEIQLIASLAKLSIDPDELDDYQNSLSTVLELVDELNQINTEGVEPLANPLEVTAELRSDEVKPDDCKDSVLSIAPQSEHDLFLVPKVIE